jgi:hypothetical protein
MKFTYSSGQRVLDGYTIKRGIGKGGFGEVYYALSDGGKEVALKLVRGQNLDTEIRGMAQCMNLKHPNLLDLFDLKTDAQGDHWVVMEYIAGEPLSAVLNRHPQGLEPELAQKWFLELARAVGCLHDHGIVHRDLKPGNIFLENGTVKVGDYGLSKFISSSQHTAQTQSVGTVHYMAPEISTGNYNKQIDIYAAGVILYEMLTGHVPFEGESAGEILMKHLTTPPDLTKLPPAYVSVVGKALAKNPAHRYASMGEMAKAVAELSEDRPRPAPAASAPRPSAAPAGAPVAEPQPAPQLSEPMMTVLPAVTARGMLAELCGSLALATILAGLFAVLWARVTAVNELTEIGPSFFLTVAVCWAVLIPAKFWDGRPGDSSLRRTIMLVLGLAIGLAGLWLDGWSWNAFTAEDGHAPIPLLARAHLAIGEGEGLVVAAGYLSYFGLGLFAVRWWRLSNRLRSHRFSLGPILSVGFWALVLLMVWPWAQVPSPYGAVALVLSSVIVQLVSPWEPPPPPAVKRMRLRYA